MNINMQSLLLIKCVL